MPDDQPWEWYTKSEIFRCVFNGLILTDNEKLNDGEINNFYPLILEQMQVKHEITANKWPGAGKFYCQWKMHPVIKDLLENLSTLAIATGYAVMIEIPTAFFCNSQSNTTHVHHIS